MRPEAGARQSGKASDRSVDVGRNTDATSENSRCQRLQTAVDSNPDIAVYIPGPSRSIAGERAESTLCEPAADHRTRNYLGIVQVYILHPVL
eukprot:COSAG06_NODE_30283_length_541_cov_1.273756_1_plen_91_part_10